MVKAKGQEMTYVIFSGNQYVIIRCWTRRQSDGSFFKMERIETWNILYSAEAFASVEGSEG